MKSPAHWLFGAAIGAMLAACASTDFSIPPVTQDSGGYRHPGKIIWHDLLTDTPEQTRAFYGELFGWTYEPLDGVNYTLIRHRGELIGGLIDQNDLPTNTDVSQWVVVMSVSDVAQATARLDSSGGTVYTPPTSIGQRGTISVVADPQGAVLALLQTRDGDPPERDALPSSGRFLWNELWADDVDTAAAFYNELVGLAVEPFSLPKTQEDIEYRVLLDGDRPRAGIRSNPVSEARPMWVSILRVADEATLGEILSRVEPLGGRVLLGATRRPAGGSMAVIAGPSGAGLVLQTWSQQQSLADGRTRR